MNIYKNCPTMQNDKYILRPLKDEDAEDLLKVYSDIKAIPLFNSDNCNGDDFHYKTLERMRQAMGFWKQAYENGWFVRFAIEDKLNGEVIGTVEGFKRDSEDFFTDCGLLRLDLRSDYENAAEIESIMSLAAKPSFEMFGCGMVATKSAPSAYERKRALNALGFTRSEEPIIGHDGTRYYDYYVLKKVR